MSEFGSTQLILVQTEPAVFFCVSNVCIVSIWRQSCCFVGRLRGRELARVFSVFTVLRDLGMFYFDLLAKLLLCHVPQFPFSLEHLLLLQQFLGDAPDFFDPIGQLFFLLLNLFGCHRHFLDGV